MSPEDCDALRNMDEDELILQHFGLALYVRNTYGLWKGNSALIRSCAEQSGQKVREFYFMDPDGASNLIVKGAWEKLRGGKD